MDQVTIKDIKFSSFFKWMMGISFSFGVITGILFCVIGLMGGNITANLGESILYGIPAAIASIFISPVVALFLGLFVCLLAYFPFKLLIKLTKGLRIRGIFENDWNEPKKEEHG
ncbi:uncharacterized protein YacL [Anaerosolibacter carboniphilus]|uniref:Uncharacterized protein YacL n=1 Tax=Anaerosolibacter carboniphilus TaxID=1417629 RepID=A0A841KPE1_9FIRM|nr:hypothetical protein [Anaerosolibacter carboniphilus]MBB6215307.1 uncharacterized protein YacL [Anaerosolibacter carboniphilus]